MYRRIMLAQCSPVSAYGIHKTFITQSTFRRLMD